jgi:hypothetical protein
MIHNYRERVVLLAAAGWLPGLDIATLKRSRIRAGMIGFEMPAI